MSSKTINNVDNWEGVMGYNIHRCLLHPVFPANNILYIGGSRNFHSKGFREDLLDYKLYTLSMPSGSPRDSSQSTRVDSTKFTLN